MSTICFFSCAVSKLIWSKIYTWLGLEEVLEDDSPLDWVRTLNYKAADGVYPQVYGVCPSNIKDY